MDFSAGNFASFVNDSRAFAQLGHGGYDSDGNHQGDLMVTAGTGGVSFQAGNSEDHYTMLGHGGTNARSSRDATPSGFTGDITVISAGGVSFQAGNMRSDGGGEDGRLYAQLGQRRL